MAVLPLLLLGILASDASASTTSRGFVVTTRKSKAPVKIVTGEGWDLFTLYQREYVAVRSRELGTRTDPNGMVRFESRALSPEIHCGDVLAISIDGEWLRFDPSRKPLEMSVDGTLTAELFQWRVAGCHDGEPLLTGTSFALVNVVARDALVGCRRVYGPPFCWDDKQLLGLEKKDKEME